ncbi:MAG TPA: sigma-70 family RNA polymerase sigma factor [Candidatus Faecimonas gallistercoris]|nr:sigma-70 family RNA polymerase sigma factor [Candidatus Faecimonas gallistercoris]
MREKEEQTKYSVDDLDSMIDIDDAVKAYFQEIIRFPLLTPSEEKNLFQKVLEGNQEAKQLFINSNLRLVVSIAKKYRHQGLDFLELIQEGNIGLITAVDKFDPTRENKFSTYASYWIKHCIMRSLEETSRSIRIPSNKFQDLIQYRKKIKILEEKINRSPTRDEINEVIGLSSQAIDELQLLQREPISLNMDVTPDEPGATDEPGTPCELGILVKSDSPTPEEITINNMFSTDVRDFLENSRLTSKEKDILNLYYGISNDNPQTLKEIGTSYGVSKQQIGMIKQKALQKLRDSSVISHLR